MARLQARAVIADDEPNLRLNLRQRLQHLWPELEVCAEAENGIEALDLLAQYKPDVIFLDICMPGLDGMQVAKQYQSDTRIVFVTAFDQYAVEAFEQHALDYLLKPYSNERLQESIRRLQESKREAADLEGLEKLLKHPPEESDKPLKWIRASKGVETVLVHVDEVVLFQSADKYTSVHTREGEFLIRTPLKELVHVLDTAQFWRVHRSAIVNVQAVNSASRTLDGRYRLQLKGYSDEVMVSRAHAHLFKQM